MRRSTKDSVMKYVPLVFHKSILVTLCKEKDVCCRHFTTHGLARKLGAA